MTSWCAVPTSNAMTSCQVSPVLVWFVGVVWCKDKPVHLRRLASNNPGGGQAGVCRHCCPRQEELGRFMWHCTLRWTSHSVRRHWSILRFCVQLADLGDVSFFMWIEPLLFPIIKINPGILERGEDNYRIFRWCNFIDTKNMGRNKILPNSFSPSYNPCPHSTRVVIAFDDFLGSNIECCGGLGFSISIPTGVCYALVTILSIYFLLNDRWSVEFLANH